MLNAIASVTILPISSGFYGSLTLMIIRPALPLATNAYIFPPSSCVVTPKAYPPVSILPLSSGYY